MVLFFMRVWSRIISAICVARGGCFLGPTWCCMPMGCVAVWVGRVGLDTALALFMPVRQLLWLSSFFLSPFFIFLHNINSGSVIILFLVLLAVRLLRCCLLAVQLLRCCLFPVVFVSWLSVGRGLSVCSQSCCSPFWSFVSPCWLGRGREPVLVCGCWLRPRRRCFVFLTSFVKLFSFSYIILIMLHD